MTTPTGTINMTHIQSEFGGANPIQLTEYYRGGAYVPLGTATSPVHGVAISTSGAISMGMFRATSKGSVLVAATQTPVTAKGYLYQGPGSLTPNTYNGVLITQIITYNNNIGIVFEGSRAKGFWTSLTIKGPGIDTGYTSTTATSYVADQYQTVWQFNAIGWTFVEGNSYTCLFS